MHSFSRFFKTLSQRFPLRNLSVLLIPSFLIITVFAACTNNEDFANPLDSANLRTAGSPENLTLYPGDKQVRVTWSETAEEGIKAYKIYRRSTGNPDELFVLIETVDAPASEFIDTQNIENDRRDAEGNILFYEYRISYIDVNDVETPDPANPPSITDEPLRVWQTAKATPSIPPPPLILTIGEPSDLLVKLFWEEYVAPPDFAMFRVEAAWDHGDGKPLIFRTIGEINADAYPLNFYYIDAKFTADNITKKYHVTVVDEFGVETTTAIRGTSPNLPPAPPKNFQARYFIPPFTARIDVELSWDRSREPDLAGYRIYTIDAEGNLLPRLDNIGKRETTATIVGGGFNVYFITAFDDTRRSDGTLDESELAAAR